MTSKNYNYDYLFKLILIGDSGVGKSCLLLRFSDDSFPLRSLATIGVDFTNKTLILEGKTVKLQIWDTAGQERFRSITTSYYKSVDGIMLVYDATNLESFRNVENWMEEIKRHSRNNEKILLVGNKCEVNALKVVSHDMGQKFADEFGLHFIETSAKDSFQVDDAFIMLTSQVLKRAMEEGPHFKEGEKVDLDLREVKRKKCC